VATFIGTAAVPLLITCFSLVASCTTSSIAQYPQEWPVLASNLETRCAIEGEYENVGVVARGGSSGFPTTAYLSTLLSPNVRTLLLGRVKVSIASNVLLIDARAVGIPQIIRVEDGTFACVRDGGHLLKFSEAYGSESGAGTLHKTQFLGLADDGSLIVKSFRFFDGSKSVLRQAHESVVWYRFTKVGAAIRQSVERPPAPDFDH
jgi:hypothetical protein